MILYACASYLLGYSSIVPITQMLTKRRGIRINPIRGVYLIALIYCVVSSCLAWSLQSSAACLTLSFACVCMATLFACDMHARILPTELVGLMLALSMMYRLLNGSLQELGIIFIAIAPLAGLLLVWNRVRTNAGKAELIGSGDVRMILPLALFSGSSGLIGGLMTGAAFMGLIAIIQLTLFKKGANENIALAPGLAIWLIVGALA